jgi:hypothetical protein
MPARTFTKELLDETLLRDNATLVEDYSGGGRRTLIKFRCSCGSLREKTFCLIVTAGAICIDCANKKRADLLAKHRTKENLQKSLQTKGDPDNLTKIYSRKALDDQIEIDSAQLMGSYPTLFGKTSIKFKCFCGVETARPFQDILGRTSQTRENGHHGALCNECNKKRWLKSREKTNLERYGKKGGINQTDESRRKSAQTSMERYGVPSPNQAESVKQKKINSSIARFGTENPAQSPDVMERTQKNAKKYKPFKMPSGEIRKVQGYEPYALKDLLKTYTEHQIATDRKDVPNIEYEVDGKKRRYFPDIYIAHEKKIVEVKSTWTYKCKTDNIQLKKRATEEAGYVYEIWCYDAKGVRIPV